MLHVHCSGTPYEIGRTHGFHAPSQIAGSIAFYAGLFQQTAKLSWAQVRATALRDFEPVIRCKWPAYLEEMRGVAEGAGVSLADVIALNVRTEIAFGLFTDGCTMVAWHGEGEGRAAYIAQNWDWMTQQKDNLISITIAQPSKPTIKMITEGGIIGKIGLNSAGVGTTLNAIRAPGMDATRMPCHLALRAVLESPSKDAAVAALTKHGVASSCTISVADRTGSVGLEWSAVDVQKLLPDEKGRLYHSNHYLVDHPGVRDTQYLPDSFPRVKRIRELCERLGRETESEAPGVEQLREVFKDEDNFPRGINRKQVEGNHSATLFNIICDLRGLKVYVTLGRPTEPEDSFVMTF